jgi:hypothetical protein
VGRGFESLLRLLKDEAPRLSPGRFRSEEARRDY